MTRSRSLLVFSLATAIAVVLAACSGPLSVRDDAFVGDDSIVSRSAVNYKLSLSSGSVQVSGMIMGLGKTTDYVVEGDLFGGYEIVCTNKGGNVAPGQMAFATNSHDDVFPSNRNGVVQLADDPNDPDAFVVPFPVLEGDLGKEYCPNGNWTGSYDPAEFLLTQVLVRFGDGTVDKESWIYLSWSCPSTSNAGACTGPEEISVTEWRAATGRD